MRMIRSTNGGCPNRYMGVVDGDTGDTQEDAYPHARTLVAFKWSFNVDGDVIVCEIRERASNVKRHGVPTPKTFHDALLYKRMQKVPPFYITSNGHYPSLGHSPGETGLRLFDLIQEIGRYEGYGRYPAVPSFLLLGGGRCPDFHDTVAILPQRRCHPALT